MQGTSSHINPKCSGTLDVDVHLFIAANPSYRVDMYDLLLEKLLQKSLHFPAGVDLL